MSQDMQPKRDDQHHDPKQEAIKYGDVFAALEGSELARKAMAPGDAAAMEAAETAMLGRTQRGCAAAARNERAGLVGHHDMNDEFCSEDGDQSISTSEAHLPGRRIITETVGGQVVGQFTQRTPLAPPCAIQGEGITIGEALEFTAMTAGEKAVEQCDAAAIHAAEARATGRTDTVPGGVAASAQSAATRNARTTGNEDKIRLADVLVDATSKLPEDKPVALEDAERVTSAEMRNYAHPTAHPTGVASSVAAAARLNRQNNQGAQQRLIS